MWLCCGQLVLERKKVSDAESASTAKKKKRKRDKATADKSNSVDSTQTEAVITSVKAEAEFVPHDYAKANLTTLLQGTLCHWTLSLLPHKQKKVATVVW